MYRCQLGLISELSFQGIELKGMEVKSASWNEAIRAHSLFSFVASPFCYVMSVNLI